MTPEELEAARRAAVFAVGDQPLDKGLMLSAVVSSARRAAGHPRAGMTLQPSKTNPRVRRWQKQVGAAAAKIKGAFQGTGKKTFVEFGGDKARAALAWAETHGIDLARAALATAKEKDTKINQALRGAGADVHDGLALARKFLAQGGVKLTKAQQGLVLLPSEKNPRQRRWQRVDPKEEWLERQRKAREKEKSWLKAVARQEPGQVDLETKKVYTKAEITRAKARLKEISKLESREAKKEQKKTAKIAKREAEKQTDLFDTQPERKHGHDPQLGLFSRESDLRPTGAPPSSGKPPPRQKGQAMLFSSEPVGAVPVVPRWVN